MELIKTKEASYWISQFKKSDTLLAKSIINSISYISSNDFENGIISKIKEIEVNSKRKIALFPVIKEKVEPYADGKPKRERYGSEGRVGHLLTNIERQFPRKYSVNPTVASMRAERVSDIVLVDDLLGTGKRILASWRTSITKEQNLQKTIESWLSYKIVNLWIVAYAAHSAGIEQITKSIKPLIRSNILYSVRLKTPPKWWKDEHDELCLRYGVRTSKYGASLGFGNLRTSIIFQHGCPNNCPAILWANGKDWTGLFPNRGIPDGLNEVFSELQPNIAIQSLFDSGQEKLALQLIDQIEAQNIKKEHLAIIVLLGLLNKKVKIINLYKYTSFDSHKIKKIINTCIKSGFLEKHLKLTELAHEVLDRYKECKVKAQPEIRNTNKTELLYVPTQLFGVPAKV